MLTIEKSINKEKWNEFLDDNQYISFLQDFEYGEIEKSLGREVLRLGFFLKESKELVGICQLVGYKGKRNGLVIHHGPVIKEQYLEEALKLMINFLKEQKYNHKYKFLRINPIESDDKISTFKKLGFILAPTYAVSENFWLKKIQKDEDMIKEMNSSHKKLVLDSLKKPFLEIEKTNDQSKLDIFWKIYEDLARRKKFIPYSKEFIFKEFEIFNKGNKALLFLGKIEVDYVSAAIVIFSHRNAFYHHSASYPVKEPINYKLQWEIIKEAQKRKCYFYNFWGIARKENSSHPWYGLSQFKKGFGGSLVKLCPAVDYRFKNSYWLIYLYEKVSRKKL